MEVFSPSSRWRYCLKPVVPSAALIVLITLFDSFPRFRSALAWAMLPDCVDYAEYVTGDKGNGVVSSTFSFMNKFCGAIGASLASYLLGIFGFAANQNRHRLYCLSSLS